MIVHSSQPIRALSYNWTQLNCWLEARPVQKDNQSYTSHAPENRYFGSSEFHQDLHAMAFGLKLHSKQNIGRSWSNDQYFVKSVRSSWVEAWALTQFNMQDYLGKYCIH